MQQKTITDETLKKGVDTLAGRDPDLHRVYARLGYPPIWIREPGFASLVHIILEQQVSIKAAATMFERLASHLESVTPDSVKRAASLDSGVSGSHGRNPGIVSSWPTA